MISSANDAPATHGCDDDATASMGDEILPTPKRSNVATSMDNLNASSHDEPSKPDSRSKGGGAKETDAAHAGLDDKFAVEEKDLASIMKDINPEVVEFTLTVFAAMGSAATWTASTLPEKLEAWLNKMRLKPEAMEVLSLENGTRS